MRAEWRAVSIVEFAGNGMKQLAVCGRIDFSLCWRRRGSSNPSRFPSRNACGQRSNVSNVEGDIGRSGVSPGI
jgi:hypothetical protein